MRSLISFSQALKADALSRSKYCVPSLLLMEKAGVACARALEQDCAAAAAERTAAREKTLRVLAVCGPGNNGGDAQVLARELFSSRGALRFEVAVLFVGEPKTEEAKAQRAMLRALKIPCSVATAASLRRAAAALRAQDYLVDGISGAGLQGAYRHPEYIRAVNATSARIFSIDVPSGMSDEEGAYPSEHGSAREIVRADVTASIGLRKAALYYPSNRIYCGNIVDIEGVFPERVFDSSRRISDPAVGSPQAYLLEPGDSEADDFGAEFFSLLPDTYKHRRGSLVVAAGSAASPGAAYLALRAAALGPAGIVHGALDREIAASASLACPAAVIDARGCASIHDMLASPRVKADAVLAGCGWGKRTPQEIAAVLSASLPAVLDADALTMLAMLASEKQSAAMRAGHKVFTPHVGELKTLFAGMQGASRMKGAAARKTSAAANASGLRCFAAADEVAARYNAVVVAKNYVSYVAHPAGKTPYVIDGRSPALATAGSGDVLAGFLASCAAFGAAALRAGAPKGVSGSASNSNKLWDMLHDAGAYAALVHARAGAYVQQMQGAADADSIVDAMPHAYSLWPARGAAR